MSAKGDSSARVSYPTIIKRTKDFLIYAPTLLIDRIWKEGDCCVIFDVAHNIGFKVEDNFVN